MITRRKTVLVSRGDAFQQPHGRAERSRTKRMLALAAAGLVVVALGVSQAQSAQAAAHLAHAKELAVSEVGSRVGIGAARVDVAALRGAAASGLAAAAVMSAQGLLDEAGPALGAEQVVGLAVVRDEVLTMVRLGAGVDALVTGTAALRAEQQATSTALAEHRAAEAARLAAEAATEAARVAAEAADAASSAEAGDAAESAGAYSGSAGDVTDVASAAATAHPYTAEFYPGLPPAPRDEDCGPCTGKPMYPVSYNGAYAWGCSA